VASLQGGLVGVATALSPAMVRPFQVFTTSFFCRIKANYYEKHGLNGEVISIPGSSLALQAMFSGELPIIQAQDLEKQFPKAKGAKPEDFADSRLVRELDQSGFIKSLLPNR
jgi:hypothetical protein